LQYPATDGWSPVIYLPEMMEIIYFKTFSVVLGAGTNGQQIWPYYCHMKKNAF
jgi:hypothetical protein